MTINDKPRQRNSVYESINAPEKKSTPFHHLIILFHLKKTIVETDYFVKYFKIAFLIYSSLEIREVSTVFVYQPVRHLLMP